MRRPRSSLALVFMLAAAASCSDSTAPPKPASIRVIAGDAQTGTAGQQLGVTPTFEVDDVNGHSIAGVRVSVTVSVGAGMLAGAPAKTTSGETSVGAWTLGLRAGANALLIAVDGLPVTTITATGLPGAPDRLTALSPTTLTGRVGEQVATAPLAQVTDAFGNPIPNAPVTVTLRGGGSAATSATSDATGGISIPNWVLGPVVGTNVLTLTSGSATTSFIAEAAPGDPARLVMVSGDAQRAFAGAAVPKPILVRVTDKYGNAVAPQAASVAVSAGGGSVSAATANPNADSTVTLPAWTLGRSAVPQTLRVTIGALATDVSATVQSDYNIEVRFFGPDMTDAQKALFTNAAARISGIVTGDVPDAQLTGVSASASCGVAGLPTLDETIDDLVIFASVQPIDGPGNVLAEAGPCIFRSTAAGNFAAVGVMLFDSADLATMAAQGIMQDVITHEMLHVVGIGTLWDVKNLLVGAGTPNVGYYGQLGRQACLDAGGAAVCGTNVPVENNGVPGTADAHWRESTFQSELMTGYVNLGPMPLSAITVNSLGDMGYVVNPLAADPYRVPGAAASTNVVPLGGAGWEKPLPGAVLLDGAGNATFIRRP